MTYLQTPKPNVIILKNALCTQNRVNVPDLIENQLKYYFKLLEIANKQPNLPHWDELHAIYPKLKVKQANYVIWKPVNVPDNFILIVPNLHIIKEIQQAQTNVFCYVTIMHFIK